MDPVTLVAALAAGAAAIAKPTAEQAIKDAYTAVKQLLARKYAHADLGQLERKPESEAKRNSLAEDLGEAHAVDDRELVSLIKVLVDTLQQYDHGSAQAVGVNIEQVKAAFLSIEDVEARGTGVNVLESKFGGGIEISKVRSVGGASPNP